MNGILKFERDILKGKDLVVNKKYNDTSFVNHWHSYYEMIYYGNCNGTCTLNGTDYKVENNCIFLLTPTDFHEINNIPDPDSFYINISFTESVVDQNIIKTILSSALVLYGVDSLLKELIFSINSVYQSKTFKYKDEYLYHTLNLILLNIYKRAKNNISDKTALHPAIKDAIIYLITTKDKDISLKQLADKYFMSPSYFSDLFHKQTGTRFKEYVCKLKINYAKRLLETTNLSVLDICYECGFNNNSHFIRSFKKSAGIPPSQFRKQIQNN